MTDNHSNQEQELLDFVLGRCDPASAERIKRQAAEDPSLQKKLQDLKNSLAALSSLGDIDPPDRLVGDTLKRIRQHQLQQQAENQVGVHKITPLVFSLRDLAAMAAIFVLLAGVLVPSIHRSRQQARIQQCAAQAGQIGSALLSYSNSSNGMLPGAGNGRRWLADRNEPAASNSAALYKLVRNNYASPTLFICPAVGGKSFIVRPEMTDFPSAQFINYSYQHSLQRGGLPMAAVTAPAGNMAILADCTPVFPQGRFLPQRVQSTASENHGALGQNVLYMGGNVSWAQNPRVGIRGNNIYLADTPGQIITDYRGDEMPVNDTDSFLLPAYSGR